MSSQQQSNGFQEARRIFHQSNQNQFNFRKQQSQSLNRRIVQATPQIKTKRPKKGLGGILQQLPTANCVNTPTQLKKQSQPKGSSLSTLMRNRAKRPDRELS